MAVEQELLMLIVSMVVVVIKGMALAEAEFNIKLLSWPSCCSCLCCFFTKKLILSALESARNFVSDIRIVPTMPKTELTNDSP
jgi:hypothetical protein